LSGTGGTPVRGGTRPEERLFHRAMVAFSGNSTAVTRLARSAAPGRFSLGWAAQPLKSLE
jgi:hypothetical protein